MSNPFDFFDKIFCENLDSDQTDGKTAKTNLKK